MRTRNFSLEELVSPEVHNLLGELAYKLFNPELLRDIDKLATNLKTSTGCTACMINDWSWKGNYTQSGFREASSTVGSKGSQHRYGNAFDLKFVGITLDEALEYLLTNQNN